MATLCARPTDCLAGRAFFGSHRGVRAAPAPGDAPAPRRPMQQQGSQIPARVSPPVSPMQSGPACGRANGRQRRRQSPPAAPHKPAMENVVILKRGEQIPPGLSVARAEKAETAVATDQRAVLAGKDESVPGAGAAAVNRGVQDKVGDSVVTAKQSNRSEAEKVVTVTFADQRGALAEKAGTVANAEERVEQANEEDEPVAVAGQSGAPAFSAEPVAARDKRKRGPNTQAKKAETAERRARDTTTRAEPVAAAAHHTVRQAKKETGRAPMAAAELAPPPAYAGTSFAVAAPDPSELPIPVLLLKRRGRAARTIRARGDDGAPVPVGAAA